MPFDIATGSPLGLLKRTQVCVWEREDKIYEIHTDYLEIFTIILEQSVLGGGHWRAQKHSLLEMEIPNSHFWCTEYNLFSACGEELGGAESAENCHPLEAFAEMLVL